MKSQVRVCASERDRQTSSGEEPSTPRDTVRVSETKGFNNDEKVRNANIWKHPKYPWTGERIKKMWYPWPWGQQVASTACRYISEHLCPSWKGEHGWESSLCTWSVGQGPGASYTSVVPDFNHSLLSRKPCP